MNSRRADNSRLDQGETRTVLFTFSDVYRLIFTYGPKIHYSWLDQTVSNTTGEDKLFTLFAVWDWIIFLRRFKFDLQIYIQDIEYFHTLKVLAVSSVMHHMMFI